MKNLIITILISAIISFTVCYSQQDNSFSGVRSQSTGIEIISGDNLTIGTSTPTLANIHIYETSTTSIAVDGSVLGCVRLLDTDGAGHTNITTLNGTVGTSTDADCGF